MHRISYLFLLLLLSSNSHAEKLFWGISAISQQVNQSSSSGLTATKDGTGLGIYADIYYQNKYRLNGTVSYVDYTNFFLTSATASADYLMPINAQATFFIGASAGAAGQVYSGGGIADSAFAGLYGVQTGAIMLLGNKLILEAGYRLKFIDLETEITDTMTIVTVDELNEIYLSLTILL